MDLIQLRMPPDKLALLVEVIEDYPELNPAYPESRDLRTIAVWLRYRLDRWNASHPATPPA